MLGEQFLVDETVEHGATVFVGKQAERAAAQQRFIAQAVIPITLQDDVAVDRGHDTVDDLAGRSRPHKSGQEQHECNRRDRLVPENVWHQNGWPMLKNTLKGRKR